MSLSQNANELNEDEDSLFGSPPPSPGRSPSPVLALPSSSTNACGSSASTVTKNVGTIALPGSQPYSESFVNPLASSLSLQTVHRPPASAPGASYQYPHTPSSSAAPLSLPPAARKSRKRKAASSSKESTPRPEVHIPLPDPSAPLPANFLRNQSGLLGVAGLVGGVHPANLVPSHARGTTPGNPIVVDEEPVKRVAAPAKRRAPLPAPSQFISECGDGSRTKPPSKDEILAILVKERNIFPIIHTLLKLTAPGQPSNQAPSAVTDIVSQDQTTVRRTETLGVHSTGYPMKRRKLNTVPAGATDWDVPYPFARGEGPDAYHETWKTVREKELIAELVSLVKAAAKKATVKQRRKPPQPTSSQRKVDDAAKKEELKQFAEEPRVNRYYKPITATYGMSTQTSSRQSTPSRSSAPIQGGMHSSTSSTTSSPAPSSASATPSPENPQEVESLDQFLSSLFAMSQVQPSNDKPSDEGTIDLSSVGDSSGPTASLDHDMLDDWVRMLEVPSPHGIGPERPRILGHSLSNSPTQAGVEFDFSTLDRSLDALLAPLSNADPPVPLTSPGAPQAAATASSASDSVIDPELLALSLPGDAVCGSLPESSAPSPMLSMSSFTGDPPTPASAEWDLAMPEIFGGGSGEDVWAMTDVQDMADEGSRLEGRGMHLEECIGKAHNKVEDDTPSFANTQDAQPPPQLPSHPSIGQVSTTTEAQSGSSPTLQDPPKKKSALAVQKEEVIKRVQERKAQLEAELKRVKLQLWETTIEQGGLNHVLAHYQEREKEQVLTPIDNAPLS